MFTMTKSAPFQYHLARHLFTGEVEHTIPQTPPNTSIKPPTPHPPISKFKTQQCFSFSPSYSFSNIKDCELDGDKVLFKCLSVNKNTWQELCKRPSVVNYEQLQHWPHAVRTIRKLEKSLIWQLQLSTIVNPPVVALRTASIFLSFFFFKAKVQGGVTELAVTLGNWMPWHHS